MNSQSPKPQQPKSADEIPKAPPRSQTPRPQPPRSTPLRNQSQPQAPRPQQASQRGPAPAPTSAFSIDTGGGDGRNRPNGYLSSDPQVNPAGAASGVWRDGKYVVLRLGDVTFPDRCVKSNQSDQCARVPIKVKWLPEPYRKGGALTSGALNASRAYAMYMQTFYFEIGLSRSRAAARTWGLIAGIFLIVVGVLALFAGVALILANASTGDRTAGMIAAIVFAAGMLLPILGILMLGWFRRSVLRFHRDTPNYIWLSGANKDFLDTLPSLSVAPKF